MSPLWKRLETLPEWESRPAIQAQRATEAELLAVEQNGGWPSEDSPEEEAFLDRADKVWWALSDVEMAYINETKGPYFDPIWACRDSRKEA